MALRKAMILVCALLLVTSWQIRIKQVNELTPHQPEEMIKHAGDRIKTRKQMVEQDQGELADALVEQDVHKGPIFNLDAAAEAVAFFGEAFTGGGLPLDPSVETVEAFAAAAAGEDAVDVAEQMAEAEPGAEFFLEDKQAMKMNAGQDKDELSPVAPEKQKRRNSKQRKADRRKAQQLAEAKGPEAPEEQTTEVWAAILYDDWIKAEKAAKEWAAKRKTDMHKVKDDAPAENKYSSEMVGDLAVDTRPRYGDLLGEDEEELAETAEPEADNQEHTPAVAELQGSESPEEQNDQPTREDRLSARLTAEHTVLGSESPEEPNDQSTRVKKLAAERMVDAEATHTKGKSYIENHQNMRIQNVNDRAKAKKEEKAKERAEKGHPDEAAAERAAALAEAVQAAANAGAFSKRRPWSKEAAHKAAAKQETKAEG